MLAHVVTVPTVNSFTKEGLLKVSSFKHIFHSSEFPYKLHKQYEHLLSKFEVAIKLDEDRLLIPSLLPEARPLSALDVSSHRAKLNHRYMSLPYVPSGFWARLISRILADGDVDKTQKRLYTMLSKGQRTGGGTWCHWRTGIQLQDENTILLSISEEDSFPVLPRPTGLNSVQVGESASTWFVDDGVTGNAGSGDSGSLERKKVLLLHTQHTGWREIRVSSLIQISTVRCVSDTASTVNEGGHSSQSLASHLLSRVVSHVETLVEDWFSGISSEVKMVPCPSCVCERPVVSSPVLREKIHQLKKKLVRGDSCDLVVLGCLWEWEELVIQTREMRGELTIECLLHGKELLEDVAPDVMFGDLPPHLMVSPSQIDRHDKLGRGAFGSIHRGYLHHKAGQGAQTPREVAIKSLMDDADADKLFRNNDAPEEKDSGLAHEMDDIQTVNVSKAHRNTRRELSVFSSLRHPHVVPLYGVCLRPLCFLMELAPCGSLDRELKKYREGGQQLSYSSAWSCAVQVASALEYLHSSDIVYSDLKAENVLVYTFPKPLDMETMGDNFVDVLSALRPKGEAGVYQSPLTSKHPENQPLCGVLVKLSDYGISRFAVAGSARGFGGTPGYMAPEVIQYFGKETYTSKVDIFSYAMFLYELITLHSPMAHATPAEISRHYQLRKRPPLAKKHMSTSIQLRELMHWCWQHTGEQRPSAREILDTLLTAAHTRLVHGFVITEELALTATAVRVKRSPRRVRISGDVGAEVNDDRCVGEVWICCGDDHCGQVKVMEYTGVKSSWKTVYTCCKPILSVALVHSLAWLGVEGGSLVLVDLESHNTVVQHCLPSRKAVMSILHVKELNRVLVAQANGSITAFPDKPQLEKLEFSDFEPVPRKRSSPVVSTKIRQNSTAGVSSKTAGGEEEDEEQARRRRPTHSICLQPLASYSPQREIVSCLLEVTNSRLPSENKREIWCGHDQGKVVILDAETLTEHAQVTVSADDQHKQRLAHLVVSYLAWSSTPNTRASPCSSEGSMVFGSVHHSWLVNCWDVCQRRLVNTIDCTQLLGVKKRDEATCLVTALHCHSTELYIGLQDGHVLVVDLSHQTPLRMLTSYHAHFTKVTSLISLPLPHPLHLFPSRSLVATCGGSFQGYVKSHQAAECDRSDGHLLVWEADWS